MKCSQCENNEANVHFSGVINGKSVNLELCEDCAKKSGLTAPLMDIGIGGLFGSPFNFAASAPPALNDLMDLLSSWHAKSPDRPATKSSCPACRWTMEQFQKTGRMGCPECYLHFQAEAENALKKVHGHITHKGKKAPSEVAKTKVREKEKSLSRLKMELQNAVDCEKFEEAAALRDKIHDIEKRS